MSGSRRSLRGRCHEPGPGSPARYVPGASIGPQGPVGAPPLPVVAPVLDAPPLFVLDEAPPVLDDDAPAEPLVLDADVVPPSSLHARSAEVVTNSASTRRCDASMARGYRQRERGT